ncbi:MAG TPA: hypothetical protein VF406_20745 [Thermodesulfobacteriota bacterium]
MSETGKNQLGKRYECRGCGAQVLCTQSGDGRVSCCDRPMVVLEPRALPSAD